MAGEKEFYKALLCNMVKNKTTTLLRKQMHLKAA